MTTGVLEAPAVVAATRIAHVTSKLGPWGWVATGVILAGAIGYAAMTNGSAEGTAENADQAADEDLAAGSAVDACSTCEPPEEDPDDDDSGEQQQQRRRELEEEANVRQQTNGRTRHGELDGGMNRANRDFDSLRPNNVQNINTRYGPGRTGTLNDGTRVTVRPGSSDGRATLEIRNPATRRGTEIRYNN